MKHLRGGILERSASCCFAMPKTTRPRSKIRTRNAFYAQSGGVSAVINASACGVIETAARSREIGKLYAGRNGILGALTEDLIDVSRESRATIRGLKYTPAGAFGSARFKLKGLDQNRAASQLAKKAGVPVSQVTRMTIWGNHSDTQYPDYKNAQIGGKPAPSVINDAAWLAETTQVPTPITV